MDHGYTTSSILYHQIVYLDVDSLRQSTQKPIKDWEEYDYSLYNLN
jgi:hypothetical protein